MRLNIREDQQSTAGYAIIDLGQRIEAPARLSIRRTDSEPHFLGREGWQPEVCWLIFDDIDQSGTTSRLRIGPSVVSRIDELESIQMFSEAHGLLGSAIWPPMVRPPIDLETGPLAATSRPSRENRVTIDVTQAVEKALQEQFEPILAKAPELSPMPPQPRLTTQKPGWPKGWLALVAVVVGLSAGGVAYYEQLPTSIEAQRSVPRPVPMPQPAPAPAPVPGPRPAPPPKPTLGEMKNRLNSLNQRAASAEEYISLGKSALEYGYTDVAFQAFDQADPWSNEEAAWQIGRYFDPLVTDQLYANIPNRTAARAASYYFFWKRIARHNRALQALCMASLGVPRSSCS